MHNVLLPKNGYCYWATAVPLFHVFQFKGTLHDFCHMSYVSLMQYMYVLSNVGVAIQHVVYNQTCAGALHTSARIRRAISCQTTFRERLDHSTVFPN